MPQSGMEAPSETDDSSVGNGAGARRSRLNDGRSLLTTSSLESQNPLSDGSGAYVRFRSGHDKALPQSGRISALAGRRAAYGRVT